MFRRGRPDPAGTRRQNAAILASGDRRAALATLTIPALVIHGQADIMIRSVGGAATAAAIPHATLRIIPGMGHDLPRPLWPQIIDAIRETAHEQRP